MSFQAIFEIDLELNESDAIFSRPLPSKLCWYDCHPLPENTVPVTCPMNYPRTKNDPWKCRGMFCHWSCVRRYNHEFLHDTRSSERDAWICIFAKLTQQIPLTCTIEMAQPRCRLQSFGGDLSIEQFRDCMRITIPPLPNEKKRHHLSVTGSSEPQADLFLLQETGITQDEPCPLYSLYAIRHDLETNKHKKPKLSYEKNHLVAHIRGEHNIHNNTLLASLPSIDILRSRMRLPFVGDPSKLQPFNPHMEKSSLEKSIVDPSLMDDRVPVVKRQGFFDKRKLATSSAAVALLSSSYNNCPSLDLGGTQNVTYENNEIPLPKIPDRTKPLKQKKRAPKKPKPSQPTKP